MVFAIPDWEDGNFENLGFRKKININEKQQNDSPKNLSKKTSKVNGVAEKSKLIMKTKSLKLIKQKNIANSVRIDTVGKNNGSQVKNSLLKPKTSKHNGTLQKSTSAKKHVKKKLPKLPKDNSNFKVEDIDTDKLDEVLLNAKTNKLNEAMKKDDVEEVLFGEDKSPELVKKKKPITQQKKENMDISNEIEVVRNKKKQKNIINEKQFKAKNMKNNIKSVDKVTNVKADNVNTENFDETSASQVLSQDRKKNKLKLILNDKSNRNTINLNRNKLRERMLERLKSAQFRFINEKLYTSSGSEASQLFQNDPTAFQSYHEGYRQQVRKWPINPLDVIVKRILKMPKSHVIADMGCGEAALARRVPHAVRSFDVQCAPGAAVELCDMARTPLAPAAVDAAVYCLALMGTDLTAYLLEANRVLKLGGVLLVAEVESRFADAESWARDVARLGFRLARLDRASGVFLFMEFVKHQAPPAKKSKLPALTLKPCIYKRR